MEDKMDWSQFEEKTSPSTDWSQFEEKESSIPSSPFNGRPNEKTGISGLVSDTKEMMRHALKSGRQFLHDLPDEYSKSKKLVEENPKRAALDFGAGALDLGKGTVNAAHDFSKYLERKELLPAAATAKIPGTDMQWNDLLPHIPEATGLEKAFNLDKPEEGDRLLRALPEVISTLGGITKMTMALKNPDLAKLTKKIQTNVNQVTQDTGKVFEDISKTLNTTGQNVVPIDKTIVAQAGRYLDKSRTTKALIARAANGDYDALRTLQSDLGHLGSKAMEHDLLTEQNKGKHMLDLRNQINEGVQTHLEGIGQTALADELNNARGIYRGIQETYFSNPQLARIFGKSQVVPKNPAAVFSTDSTEMNRFKAAHPVVEKKLAQALRAKKNRGRVKAVAKTAAAGLSTAEAMKLLSGS